MGRRTSVELTLSTGCDVEGGVDILLTFGPGVTPAETAIHADPSDDAAPDWSILRSAVFLALILVGGVASWILFRIMQLNHAAKTPEQIAARIERAQRQMALRNAARAARGLTAAGDEPSTEEDPEPRIKWNTPLEGLGTDWSFKDAWVSNVTLGATALVALIATSDVLEAVLGEKPKAALALVTVAAAIAALLVGLGPLLLKAIGEETGTPTVLGTVLAGMVALFGSFLQIGAVTLQAARLASGFLVPALSVAGLCVAGIVALYGARSLVGYLSKGTEETVVATPPEVRAAWIIAKAIRPEVQEMELSPLDISEILSEDPALRERRQAEISHVAQIAAGHRTVAPSSALL